MIRFLLFRLAVVLAVAGWTAVFMPAVEVGGTLRSASDALITTALGLLVPLLPLLVFFEAKLAARLRPMVWMALVAAEVFLAACASLYLDFSLTFSLLPVVERPIHQLLVFDHVACGVTAFVLGWTQRRPAPVADPTMDADAEVEASDEEAATEEDTGSPGREPDTAEATEDGAIAAVRVEDTQDGTTDEGARPRSAR